MGTLPRTRNIINCGYTVFAREPEAVLSEEGCASIQCNEWRKQFEFNKMCIIVGHRMGKPKQVPHWKIQS